MLYYRLPYILYRDYPDFGYLTDNRNFGYDTACNSCVKVGDRVLSKTGSVFYSVLTDKPQSEGVIAEKLVHLFVGVTVDEIVADVGDFFQELAKDGFVGCSHGEVSCPVYFSYADMLPKTLQDNAIGESTKEEEYYEKWGQNYHYFPEHYRKGVMSRELFLQILEQCKECNVLSITLSGGEPMLNPDLLFFNNKYCRYHSSFSIITAFDVNAYDFRGCVCEDSLKEQLKRNGALVG